MPEYLAPGVYVEEIATGPVPIEGVSTSTAGFVGQTQRGPTEPRLITSWIEFQRWYGGLFDPDSDDHPSYLPFAIKGFFDNGGQRAFVARVSRSGAPGGAAASRSTVTVPTATQNLVLSALGPADLDDRILVRVRAASRRDPTNPAQPDPERFRLTILYYRTVPPAPFVDPLDPAQAANPNRREPEIIEDFDDLEFDPDGGDYVVKALRRSSLVTADPGLVAGSGYDDLANNPPDRPNNSGYIAAAGGGYGNGDLLPADYRGTAPTATSGGTGLAALAAIDEISLLCAPDEAHTHGDLANVIGDLRNQLILQCEQLTDRFAILQLGPDDANYDTATPNPPASTSYAAVYYPWIRVVDPGTGDTVLVPPGGHVAGVYARTDIERGVHKAPANALVRGIVTRDLPGGRRPLDLTVTKRQQDLLNPRGINVIRDFRADGNGIRVWGARTLSSDAQWKYVNVRRLFMFVEESVEEGTQWVVFEPNDEPTWARVRRSITNFLIGVWRSGALMGTTQAEAFFVKCDRTTMTQDDIDNGRLVCYVGMAPVKPAEFVIFRFSQKTLDAT